MKKTLSTEINLLATTGLLFVAMAQAATVSNVSVRQNWPWDKDVYVEFTLSGASASSPVDVTFTATDNGQSIVLPDNAVSGKRFGLTADGAYRLIINPAKIPVLKSEISTGSFQLALSAVATSASNAEVLYKIFDLNTKAVTDVTRGALLNGDYGAFSTSLDWIDASGVKTNSPVVWTGVTGNTYYATEALVLRKIPAGTFVRGTSTVCLTNDFWIGIFECTQRQWEIIRGTKSGSYFSYWNRRPVEQTSYFKIREGSNDTSSACAVYGWPTNSSPENDIVNPTSFMGALRTRFSDAFRFDLPTEAQWEYACLGGTTESVWNNGKPVLGTNLDTNLNPIACYGCNDGLFRPNATHNYYWWDWSQSYWWLYPTNGTAYVGTYLPNAWGLYDMYGNVAEISLDIYGTLPTGVVTNPIGATSGASRSMRGGMWCEYPTKWTPAYRQSTSDSDGTASGGGFRIAIPFPK